MKLPGDNVFVRLGVSSIHGVGVIAITDIPKGTNIFGEDTSEIVWINKEELQDQDPEIKRLCDDFCIIKDGKYGCPTNFNNMTVGWYLNMSKDNPNVMCTENYDFIATRDIKKGEELTIDYSTFSERA